MKLLLTYLFFLVCFVYRTDGHAHGGMPSLPDLLASSDKFSDLVDLVKFAGLHETVTEATDITIFAPTNKAFKMAAKSIGCKTMSKSDMYLECLKERIGMKDVMAVLKYHVVPGVFNSTAVLGQTEFMTLAGQKFMRNGTSLIGAVLDAKPANLVIDMLDLKYDHGIVHVIDSPVYPAIYPDLPTIDKLPSLASGKFNILLALIKRAGLTETLVQSSFITVFAPTDYAFRLTATEVGCEDVTNRGIAKCLLDAIGLDGVLGTLAYHLVYGVYPSERVLTTKQFYTLAKVPFYRNGLTLIDQAPALTNPRLIKTSLDIKFKFGVVHAINRVLIPFNTGEGSACDQIEFPLSLKDGSFIPLFKLTRLVRKCMPLRRAIRMCRVLPKDICKSRRGRRIVGRVGMKIRVGKIVAAAKKCGTVARAAKMCVKMNM